MDSHESSQFAPALADSILNTMRQSVLLLDQDLQIIRTNPWFYTTFQIPPLEKVLGKKISELGNGQWNIPALHRLLEKILRENSFIENFEVQHTFEHLGPRTMILNARRVSGPQEMILLIIDDVTDSRQARDAKYFLAAIVESAGDSIITINPQGVITTWNQAAELLYGYSASEVIGRPLSILAVPEAESLQTCFDKIMQGQRLAHFEVERIRKDHQHRFFSVELSPVKDFTGKIIAISTISRDITERIQAEEALEKARHQVAAYAADLEQAVADRTRHLEEKTKQLEGFSYTVAHDLRAPLRAISGYADLLNLEYQHLLRPDAKDYLHQIKASAYRLDALIQDLLSYSRVEQVALQRKPVDLNKVLQSVLKQMESTISAHQAQILLQSPLPWVQGDETSLEHVFLNLFFNALKFHRPTVPPKVQITSEEKGDCVRVLVKDNGIGIPREYQQKIFGMFERLHDAHDYPGTGVGLAIVAKAVERLGGKRGVESEPNAGSTFWVELPKA